MAVVYLPPSTARADGNTFYRWGIGWDNGLAGRYMLSPSVGLGLRLDSHLWTGISTGYERGHNDYVRIDWMLFQQSPIGKHLKAGPFVELQWAIRTFTWYRPLDRIGVAIGMRPAFVYKDRFIIESRVGLEFSYQDEVTNAWSYHDIDGTTESERIWDYTYDLHSIDDDVRLISRLRFILMF